MFNYELEDMDDAELEATLAPGDVEALAIFGRKVGGRLEVYDGAGASHRIVRVHHMPGAVGRGSRPGGSGDKPVVIFAKLVRQPFPSPTSPTSPCWPAAPMPARPQSQR